MTRFDEDKGKCEVGARVFLHECLEGTSARTRPVSYDDIMLARQAKGLKARKLDGDSVVTDTSLAGEMAFQSQESGIPVNQPSLTEDFKHDRHNTREGSSRRKREASTYRKNEELLLDKHTGSRGRDFKLKSIVEKNISSNEENDIKVGRFRPSIPEKGVFPNDDYVNESGKKHSGLMMSKGRVPEGSKEKPGVDGKEHPTVVKELSRKRKIVEHRIVYPENEYRNRSARDVMHAHRLADQVRVISVKERRHTHHIEVGSIRGRMAVRKHDSEKKQVDSKVHGDESRTNRRRSLSREPVNGKNVNSVLHSPKLTKQTTIDKGDQQERLFSSTERLRREHSSAEKKRVSATGFGNHFRHDSGSSSGLGGYSPRKRKTDAGGKTPSPTHRSPEKRTAGWDLQPAEIQGTANDATLSNMEKVTQSSSLNNAMLHSGTPIAPVPVKPIHHAFSLHMQAIESVQLTEATRPMRRLYVDNLPASASEKDLIECVNQFLLSSGVNRIQGAQPCISCIIHKDKGQALLEFLTPEDASAALTLKGLYFLGTNLSLRRPKDYSAITTVIPEKAMITVDSISDIVEDSPHKIFLGGISNMISSKMLLDIAKAFGTVKAFHFEQNNEINEPCAFLEYVDHSVTTKACAGLSGLRLGGKVVIAVFATPDAVLENFGKPPFYGIPEHAKLLLEKPTSVLKLKNVLDAEHLLSMAEPELEAVLEDIKLECSRFGVVKSLNIVKPLHPCGTTETFDVKENASINGCSTEHDLSTAGTQQLTIRVSESGEPNRSKCPEALGESETTDISGSMYNEISTSECLNHDARGGTSMTNAGGDFHSEKETIPTEDLSCHENSGNIPEPPVEDPQMNSSRGVIPEFEMENKSEEMNIIDSDMRSVASTGYEPSGGKESGAFVENGTRSISIANVCDIVDDNRSELSSIFEAGSVFVEYKRSEAACLAAHSLHGRTFDGRVVGAGYVDHDLYRRRFRR